MTTAAQKFDGGSDSGATEPDNSQAYNTQLVDFVQSVWSFKNENQDSKQDSDISDTSGGGTAQDRMPGGCTDTGPENDIRELARPVRVQKDVNDRGEQENPSGTDNTPPIGGSETGPVVGEGTPHQSPRSRDGAGINLPPVIIVDGEPLTPGEAPVKSGASQEETLAKPVIPPGLERESNKDKFGKPDSIYPEEPSEEEQEAALAVLDNDSITDLLGMGELSQQAAGAIVRGDMEGLQGILRDLEGDPEGQKKLAEMAKELGNLLGTEVLPKVSDDGKFSLEVLTRYSDNNKGCFPSGTEEARLTIPSSGELTASASHWLPGNPDFKRRADVSVENETLRLQALAAREISQMPQFLNDAGHEFNPPPADKALKGQPAGKTAVEEDTRQNDARQPPEDVVAKRFEELLKKTRDKTTRGNPKEAALEELLEKLRMSK